MPDPEVTVPVTDPPAPEPAPVADPPAPEPEVSAEPPQPPEPPAPTVREIKMTDRAYGEALQKERERGKRTATREFEEKLKTSGFNTLDELLAKVTQPEPEPKPAPKAPDQGENMPDERPTTAKLERELARVNREKAEKEAEAARLLSEKKAAEHAKLALEARYKLEKAAMAAGVKDVDYGISLYERSLQGLSEEELAKRNESDFFTGLRQDKPYLFGETVVPAQTGTGPGNAPGAPGPGSVSSGQGAAAQFNAMKASAAEVQERLRQLKINPNGAH